MVGREVLQLFQDLETEMFQLVGGELIAMSLLRGHSSRGAQGISLLADSSSARENWGKSHPSKSHVK